MNIAVLLAGGVGKRLNAGKPKQFVDLLGKPMILYAMEIETGEGSYMPTLFVAKGEEIFFSLDDGLNKIHIQIILS